MGLRLLPPSPAPDLSEAQPVQPAPARPPAPERPVQPMRAATAAAPVPAVAEVPLADVPDERTETVDALDWGGLATAVAACRACGLCESRRNTVLGVGPAQADWMVVGEAPGEQEDLQGEPFVGPAGQLLDNMLRALGLDRRRNVYIANVLKCRPPGNRNPQPEEVARCEPFLRRQVALVQPRVILAMGRFAVQTLLQSSEPIGRLRGRVHAYQGVPVVVTYHPAYLLRNLPDKAKAWADLCLAADLMDGGGA
ncbi:uracil-DNA glycosylase [Ramlibacter tataouinensis]|uniref:uracil-DNA glycosylase n=1 Tax=Ramlibacter tataouinensis TaxID=94132 RepID=UPI003F802BE7